LGLPRRWAHSGVLQPKVVAGVNPQVGGHYNVVKPDFGPNWQIRAQVQFMFPK